MPPPLLLVVMGVSGAGKTTVATEIKRRMEEEGEEGKAAVVEFVEADQHHTEESKEKMRKGEPIEDRNL